MASEVKHKNFNEILTQYDVIASYNIEKIEAAQQMYLADHHTSENCEKSSGRLISFAIGIKTRVAIFVEGLLSMEASSVPKERYREMLQLDPEVNMDNVLVFGWDMDGEILWQERQEYNKKLQSYVEKTNQPYEKLCLINLDIEKCELELKSIIPEFALEDVETKGLEWLFKVPTEKYDRFVQTIQKLCALAVQQIEVRKELLLVELPVLDVRMPERVESMAQTARKVAQLQSEGKLPDLAIFVSGAAHLKKMKTVEDNSYSLDSFYAEIAKHKSAVLFQKDVFKNYF